MDNRGKLKTIKCPHIFISLVFRFKTQQLQIKAILTRPAFLSVPLKLIFLLMMVFMRFWFVCLAWPHRHIPWLILSMAVRQPERPQGVQTHLEKRFGLHWIMTQEKDLTIFICHMTWGQHWIYPILSWVMNPEYWLG